MLTRPLNNLYRFSLLLCLGWGVALPGLAQGNASDAVHSQSPSRTQLSKPEKVVGIGIRKASQNAFGSIKIQPLNYVETAFVGIAIITNNNDNDGQPATFTGGSGSNMAAGG
jgi:hypothetical protein